MGKTEIIIRLVMAVSFLFLAIGLCFLTASCFLTNVDERYAMLVAGVILSGIPIFFFIIGLQKVFHEDRVVIEVFGAFYKIKGPGLIWICPFIMGKRVVVDTREQAIPLFPEKPTIDFKGGGNAVLIEPMVWVRVKGAKEKNEALIRESIFKMTYDISNWWDAVRENVEMALRNYLNKNTPEEILEHFQQDKWWDVVNGEAKTLEAKFEELGIEITKITITDFGWTKEVVEARQAVFDAERSVLAASHDFEAECFKAQKEARRLGGAIVEIKKLLVEQGYEEEEAKKLAPVIFNFIRATETGSVFFTSAGEDGNLSAIISQAVATFAKISDRKGLASKPKEDKADKTDET